MVVRRACYIYSILIQIGMWGRVSVIFRYSTAGRIDTIKNLPATARLQTPDRCHSQFHIEHPQILGVVTVQHLLATATRRRGGVCAPRISRYSVFLEGHTEEQI